MIEQITKEVLLEVIEKLERHAYAPELNTVHYHGLGRHKSYSIPRGTSIEDAINIILKDEKELDKIAFHKFGSEYIKYKLFNNKNFTESQIKFFVHEDVFEKVDRDEGENRRWSRSVTITRKVEDRYFEVTYEEGLTEYQEDGYFESPYEVERHEEVVTKTIVTYKAKVNN